MIALGVSRAPELVQVTRHRSGRAYDHVARSGQVVDRADHLGLRGQRCVTQGKEARYLVVPIRAHLLVLLLICVADGPSLQPLVQRLKRRSGIAGQCQAGKLVAVELGDVDVDETNFGVLERGARRGCEIAVARAHTDDDVGLRRDAIGGERSGRADPSQGARSIEGNRTLAGLCFGHGDPGALRESGQDGGRL